MSHAWSALEAPSEFTGAPAMDCARYAANRQIADAMVAAGQARRLRPSSVAIWLQTVALMQLCHQVLAPDGDRVTADLVDRGRPARQRRHLPDERLVPPPRGRSGADHEIGLVA